MYGICLKLSQANTYQTTHKAGLYKDWKVGADYIIQQTLNRSWLVGLWLGDEPEILGVGYDEMCELILYLKQGLIKAGRGEVFLAYNDVESGQLNNMAEQGHQRLNPLQN
jgi:hypothetical protein